jgi:hypothetical protein
MHRSSKRYNMAFTNASENFQAFGIEKANVLAVFRCPVPPILFWPVLLNK